MKKNSGIAVLLSLIWTGLGQIYSGRIGRGLVMMAVTPLLWGTAWVLGPGAIVKSILGAKHPEAVGAVGVLLTLLPIAYWIWGMVDAKRLCDRSNRELRSPLAADLPAGALARDV
jgi:hypothetical protein